MKKWIAGVFVTIIVLGLLAAGSYAVYRLGYMHGVQAAADGEGWRELFSQRMPERFALPDDKLRENREYFMHPPLPQQGFDQRGIITRGIFPSRMFFSPLSLLFRAAGLALLLWLIYKVIKAFRYGQGWQLTFQPRQAGSQASPPAVEPQPVENPET